MNCGVDIKVNAQINADLGDVTGPIERVFTLLINRICDGFGSIKELLIDKSRDEVVRSISDILRDAELCINGIKSGGVVIRDVRLLSQKNNMITTNDSEMSGRGRVEPTIATDRFLDEASVYSVIKSMEESVNVAKALIGALERVGESVGGYDKAEISDDWIRSWRDGVGKVSDDEMREIWSGILAGEFMSPGKYPLRVFDAIRCISSREAKLISSIFPFVLSGSIVIPSGGYFERRGFDLEFWLKMQEYGVLLGAEIGGVTISYPCYVDGFEHCQLVGMNYSLIIKSADRGRSVEEKSYVLTEVGKCLLSLSVFDNDLDYIRHIGKVMCIRGFSVDLGVNERRGDGGRLINIEKIEVYGGVDA